MSKCALCKDLSFPGNPDDSNYPTCAGITHKSMLMLSLEEANHMTIQVT